MKTIYELIVEHNFFRELPVDILQTISGCGKNEHYKANEYLAREGDAADYFYVIRSGVASIQVHHPARGTVLIQSLSEGDVAGWSWIFPPYLWTFDLRVEQELSVIALDGRCLRDKCDADNRLGYLLMKHFARIMSARLVATRLQLLDVYGSNGDVTA